MSSSTQTAVKFSTVLRPAPTHTSLADPNSGAPAAYSNTSAQSRVRTQLYLDTNLSGGEQGSYIQECVRSSLKIAELQLFGDGNHRTAVLALSESLAAVNIHLDGVRPFEIYARISNVGEQTTEALVEDVTQFVRSCVRLPVQKFKKTKTSTEEKASTEEKTITEEFVVEKPVTDADREEWAAACKYIGTYRDRLVAKQTQIRAAGSLLEKRKIFDDFKRDDINGYLDYKRLNFFMPQ
ncbi:hypothetical protein B0H19DRAFT_1083391 [Mycena capillaripes]|nr:hypothetical protein B0H19DRAFT_1083391 [Mycena capillaripes]